MNSSHAGFTSTQAPAGVVRKMPTRAVSKIRRYFASAARSSPICCSSVRPMRASTSVIGSNSEKGIAGRGTS